MLAASIVCTMMEAASTSGMLVNFYQTTQHNIPDNSHLQRTLIRKALHFPAKTNRTPQKISKELAAPPRHSRE
jgi:hypothetical protein